jgi:organic radical activating enzyme
MDIIALKSELEQKFELVCFYDLADAVIQHGEIFKIFKKHHSSKYTPNQRLVFYTASEPSQLVLNHLQRAATSIDISNYFIIICTPHNVEKLLDTANKKYGNDTVTMQWYSCNIHSTKSINSDKIYSFETFCSVPFGLLSVHASNNTARPCCKYQEKSESLDKNTIIDVFAGQSMNQLRDDIKHGRKHKNCKTCWTVEESGGTSMRKQFNNKYIQQCDQEWIDDPKIRDLTISPSNLCNFKCRICSPTDSSKIAIEELKFSSDPIEKQKLKKLISVSNRKNSLALNQILRVASNLNFLHILGGEPFMWQDLDRLIDQLIDTGQAENIQIEFNTNGSRFPNHVISKLLKFKSVEILVSIDDIEDRFEIQRGGQWSEILKNILAFASLKSPTFSVKLIVTVNIQNILYLDQLVDFCNNHNLEIVWWFLETPQSLCIDFVNGATKDIVFKKYIDHPNSELQSIAKRMYLTPAIAGDQFLDYVKKLDQRRMQDSSLVLKEIIDAMSG